VSNARVKHACAHLGLGVDRLLLNICHVDGKVDPRRGGGRPFILVWDRPLIKVQRPLQRMVYCGTVEPTMSHVIGSRDKNHWQRLQYVSCRSRTMLSYDSQADGILMQRWDRQ
jgi:hypothetical protein